MIGAGRKPSELLSSSADGMMVSWDVTQGADGHLLAKLEAKLLSFTLMDQGNLLILGDLDGGVHWLDMESGHRKHYFKAHKKGVFSLLFHEDRLYSAGGDGYLGVWDITNPENFLTLKISEKSLRSLQFNPLRESLFIGSSDHSIYEIDTTDLSQKAHWQEAHSNSVFCLNSLPNSSFLFSGGRDGQLKKWNTSTGELLLDIPAHRTTINSLCPLLDGKYLASASRDKEIRIWSSQTLELLQVLKTDRDGGHQNSVNTLYWDPLNELLFSAGDDNTIISWEIQ